MSKASRKRTEGVGTLDREGKILVPDGHKGRSQKGCFGNTPNWRKKKEKKA